MDCTFCGIRDGRLPSTSVFYFHLHLIPRWTGDGVGFDWTLAPGDASRIQAVATQIRAAL